MLLGSVVEQRIVTSSGAVATILRRPTYPFAATNPIRVIVDNEPIRSVVDAER